MKALSIKVERDNRGKFKRWDYGPLLERFLSKVDKTDKCWLWTGAKNKQGYGSLKISGRQCRANRISYQLFNGDIPNGHFVMHTCDNPACVNPAHLITGSPKENTQDMFKKGRNGLDFRAAQLKGSRVKRQRTLENRLPIVIGHVKELIKSGVNPTMRQCARDIPGYNAILGHYMRHSEIVAMAKGGSPS